MPNYATFDVETTIKNNGNPFTKGNKLCIVGLLDNEGYTTYDIEYTDSPYGDSLRDIKRRLEAADCIIGFNIKFDIHWILNYVDVHFRNVFDTQLCEFILSDQSEAYPALDSVGERRGLGRKLDVVANEYWVRGIDTPNVPAETLFPYCEQDVRLTRAIFDQQVKELGAKKRLFYLQCKDLLILLEMERNGLYYDFEKARQLGAETRTKIEGLDAQLRKLAGVGCINWNSSDHVSCLLHGGIVYERYREQYVRTLKDGTPKLRERWSFRPIELPRLVEPSKHFESEDTKKLDESALRVLNDSRHQEGKRPKQRIYSVAEPVLRKLRPRSRQAKAIISGLLERAELQKLDTTYYTGLADKIEPYEWGKDMIHGQFHQVNVITGRLASSKPNLQNFAGAVKGLFYSRYN